MSNRLADALSPYLLQHADNPVDWYPWGEEAFAAARDREVPILLSVGYAACHWCHVMARESFADPRIAAVMNEGFVNVKVDREERPDVDAIYMAAVQLMTGSGGWPMTVFLTPAGEPFYGGTYYPPQDRPGAPGILRVLGAVNEAWNERRDQVVESAAALTSGIREITAPFGPTTALESPMFSPATSASDEAGALLDAAVSRLLELEDRAHGGFGPAPKFPPHSALAMLLASEDERAWPLAIRTLDAMAEGGIFDHLHGGFFRYSVDRRWHVPHFEKMLYDNAQLLRVYARAYDRTREERFKQVAYQISGWLEREMKVSDGDSWAYISSLDADSEGEEGRYYAWRHEEFMAVIEAAEADAELASAYYGITQAGDFEGGNVLRRQRSFSDLAAPERLSEEEVSRRLSRATEALRDAAQRRVRPAADDKVLTSWNGLMMSALAEAGTTFEDGRLIELAGGIARFVRAKLWRDGRLLHVWRGGEARVDGLLEDHAFFGLGLIAYYRASFEPWALEWALELAAELETSFKDIEGGGYFSTAEPGALIVRPQGFVDGATPSENASAAELAWWAARYRSDEEAVDRALEALKGVEVGAGTAPQSFGTALRLLALKADRSREIVLVAPARSRELIAAREVVAADARASDIVLHVHQPGSKLAELPLAAGRLSDDPSEPFKAYVCSGGVCHLPVADVGALSAQLRAR